MALTNPNPFGSKAKKLSPKPTPRLFNPNPFGSVATPPPASLFGGPQKSAGSVPVVAKVSQQRPLTAQQIAQQTVEASLAPILASLGVQRKDLRSEQQSQQQALKDFTNQVMQYIAGIPAQAAGSYNEAAAATTNLAQQAATGLANLNPSAETNSLLQSIGAPQQQIDAIQAQNQNVFGGGGATLFKTAGAIPADVIAQDKAAQLGFYQGLPAVAGLTGTQAMKQLLFTQAKDSRSLAEKLAEVQAKRPSLVQGALSDMQDAQAKADQAAALNEYRIGQLQVQQQNAKTKAQWNAAQIKIDKLNAQSKAAYNAAKLQTDAVKVQNDAQYKSGKLGLDQQKIGIDQQNADTRAADVQAKQALAAQKLNTQAEQWAARYNLDTQKLDLQERKFKASKVSGGKRGFTPSKISSFRKTAGTIATAAFNGVPDHVPPLDPLSYQEALVEMTQGEGIPLSIAQQSLSRYWRPGAPGIKFKAVPGPEKGYYYFDQDVNEDGSVSGRPKVPFQLRPKAR